MVIADDFTEVEIQTAKTIDQYRAQRRYFARERWRNSTNHEKAYAVVLAEAGYGCAEITARTGVRKEDALTLVTGE